MMLPTVWCSFTVLGLWDHHPVIMVPTGKINLFWENPLSDTAHTRLYFKFDELF